MTNKVCTNEKCPAFAHFVYTVAMRCVLCRCDLMAVQRNLQMVAEGRTELPKLLERKAPGPQ
jgi:hypothetical protein